MYNRLGLNDYAEVISLYEPFKKKYQHVLFLDEWKELVDRVLEYLLGENDSYQNVTMPTEYLERRKLIRALLNLRPPKPLMLIIQDQIDQLLQGEINQKEVVFAKDLPDIDGISLWKGDITNIAVDAIVNAANNNLLGCFQPLHNCIDNAIHSAGGPRIREDCQRIMEIQGALEKTGSAKITRAYNLPSRFIIHTVGPIVSGLENTQYQMEELAACYTSCLNLSAEIKEIKSIAFCCISTGVFGFPKDKASEIAIQTVFTWQKQHPNRLGKIIFNVFTNEDYALYKQNMMKVFY